MEASVTCVLRNTVEFNVLLNFMNRKSTNFLENSKTMDIFAVQIGALPLKTTRQKHVN